MGSGQTGEVQLLYYLSMYVIVASMLLSIFATAIGATGVTTPSFNTEISTGENSNDIFSFVSTFTGLLVWVVPPSILPIEIQIIFVKFPELCIAGLGIILLLRLIP